MNVQNITSIYTNPLLRQMQLQLFRLENGNFRIVHLSQVDKTVEFRTPRECASYIILSLKNYFPEKCNIIDNLVDRNPSSTKKIDMGLEDFQLVMNLAMMLVADDENVNEINVS
ncbi:hypothetical protein [Pseudalkalibacillus decolorationis]|uniref:hypothetical protein n=1 Tax=Pseudalkalibacillus decolorationis TaxID=163879 RepID=UPI0021477C7D|nr:hypothetical protein [Pseudalkalibacillus decolorationis]